MVNMFRWLFNRAIQPTWFYRSIEKTELDTWPSRRDNHEVVRQKLRALGYRPVKFGEHPKEGTRVVNCNNFRNDRGGSQGNWLRKGVIRGHWRKVLYDVPNGSFDHHKYSDPYFSEVFWVYDEQLVHIGTTKESTMKFMVVSPTFGSWAMEVGSVTYRTSTVFELKDAAVDVAKRLAERHGGHEFLVVKAVLSVMKSSLIVTKLDD